MRRSLRRVIDWSRRRQRPELSVVVVAYRMNRELPRTLRSLSPAMQRGIEPGQYEIIVVDNGSPEPAVLEPGVLAGTPVASYRLPSASPSPVAAVNFGLRHARGGLIGVMIDGARLASPGLLAHALLARRLAERPVIASLGFHLGPAPQQISVANGYDQREEDRLLDNIGWTEDGYRLFDISVPAGSSADGFFLPIAESNALFLPRELWAELGGFDERFTCPGGGLVNLDTYVRACELPGIRLIVLLGEGTFHQVHGGISTNASASPWDAFHQEYLRIRGKAFAPPDKQPVYLGRARPQALPVIEQSARASRERQAAAPAVRPPS